MILMSNKSARKILAPQTRQTRPVLLRIRPAAARHRIANRLAQDGDLWIGALPRQPELHPCEVVRLVGFHPMVFRIDLVGQVVDAFGRSGDVELLSFSRLMVVIAPSYRDPLQRSIALEVRAAAALLHQNSLVSVDEAEGDLDALADDRASERIAITDLEERHCTLMPVVVLRMEKSNAGRLAVNDVAVPIQDLLRGVSALVVVDAVDVAGRDLTTATNLQWPIADVDVGS